MPVEWVQAAIIQPYRRQENLKSSRPSGHFVSSHSHSSSCKDILSSNPLLSMDSFTAITTFFSTIAAKAEDITMEQPPTNEEGSGSGGGAYCVVA
ncbi:hypothetical protein BDN71DRAFT_1440100 [Pleurotus eryngii]|uniref:Pheromone n=1 Tax=Pleurotus eryngii TaxID=5323 RepID=A0A9P6DJK7_PLEER|nr:hypothetical protein BDN71DRAFT_1440100 [Pleurotus eryngii]